MTQQGPAGPGAVVTRPGVHQVVLNVEPVEPGDEAIPAGGAADAAGLAAALGATLLTEEAGLPVLLHGRGLVRPVTPAHLDELRLLASRVAAAERVVLATRDRALAAIDGRLGVRPSPTPHRPTAAADRAGDPDGDARPPLGLEPERWDPRPSRRRALAAVLVGVGAALVLAGFGVGFWIVLAALLLALSVAARMLRVPPGTLVDDEAQASADAQPGPEVVSATDRLFGHHPPGTEASHLVTLVAEVPAVRATYRLAEQARARFDVAWEALGQPAAPRGQSATELAGDLARRASAPVVLDEGAAPIATRVASALPAAAVLVVDVGPSATEPGRSGPGSGDLGEGDPSVSPPPA